MTTSSTPGLSALPRIASLRVVPVAGRDGMLLNLSGAHAPFFTRNLLILTDSAMRPARCMRVPRKRRNGCWPRRTSAASA